MPPISSPPKQLLQFLKPYDPAIRDLALKLRVRVLEELAPCHESIWDAYNAVALGYGLSGRLKDNVCHIAVYAGHVDLGFNQGAHLADPRGILEGDGRNIRHMTIATPADLARPAIREYLRRARAFSDGSIPAPKSVISTVKGDYPTRRRPGSSGTNPASPAPRRRSSRKA
ncbi:MAG TPA: DUF1801 domain-containing protein [Bryobacteraceae bacterium]|jgi:hypothetical protein